MARKLAKTFYKNRGQIRGLILTALPGQAIILTKHSPSNSQLKAKQDNGGGEAQHVRAALLQPMTGAQSDGKTRCLSSGQHQRTVVVSHGKAGVAAERESLGQLQRQQTMQEHRAQSDGEARCLSCGQHQRTVEENCAQSDGKARCWSCGQHQRTVEENRAQSDGKIGRAHV